MKLKQQHFAIIGIILLAAIALYLGTGQRLEVIGFDTISLQRASIISSDEFFHEPVYQMSLVVTGSGGYAKANITPSMVKEFGIAEPERPVYITINMSKSICTYKLLPTNVNISTLSVNTYSCKYVSTCASSTTCYSAKTTQIGTAYYIDSATIFDYAIDVGLDGQKATLTPSVPAAQIGDVARVKMLGSLVGTTACPIPATDAMVFRYANTSNMILVDKNRVNDVLNAYSTTVSLFNSQCKLPICCTCLATKGDTTLLTAYNTKVSQMLASPPAISQYCTNFTTNGTTTSIACTPPNSPIFPELLMYVKASYVGQVVPAGMPKVISVSSPQTEATNLAYVDVLIKNEGTEADSFDVSLACSRQITTQATRININAGETKTARVSFSGSGMILNCNATAASVNSPTRTSTLATIVQLLPFCDKAQPSLAHVKINTEYGCFWVCPNRYSKDVDERTCAEITDYNRVFVDYYDINAQPVYSRKDFAGNHCLMESKYAKTNQYMDAVFEAKTSIFIPTRQTDKEFLPSPYCSYVKNYGVGVGEDFIYDYSVNPIEGSEQNISGLNQTFTICPTGYTFNSTSNSCYKVGETTITCASGYTLNTNTGICEKQGALLADNSLLLVGFVIGVIVILGFLVMRKKKRR